MVGALGRGHGVAFKTRAALARPSAQRRAFLLHLRLPWPQAVFGAQRRVLGLWFDVARGQGFSAFSQGAESGERPTWLGAGAWHSPGLIGGFGAVLGAAALKRHSQQRASCPVMAGAPK